MRRKHTHAHSVTHTHAHTERKTQAGLMMVPPRFRSPWQWCRPTTQDSRGHDQVTTPPRLIRHESLGLFFFSLSLSGWRGGRAQWRPNLPPAACHPPSLHLSTISTTFLEVYTFERGKERGREGGVTLWVMCWARQHTWREGFYNVNINNNTTKVSVSQCGCRVWRPIMLHYKWSAGVWKCY